MVAYHSWPLLVVSVHDGVDPTHAVACDFADLTRGFSLRHQPDDLPMAALHRVLRLSVACFDLFDTQMCFDGNTLIHPTSISQDLILYPNLLRRLQDDF